MTEFRIWDGERWVTEGEVSPEEWARLMGRPALRPYFLPPLNPMSTAPRDGRPVVVWLKGWGPIERVFDDSRVQWVAGGAMATRMAGIESPFKASFGDDWCLGWWPVPGVAE